MRPYQQRLLTQPKLSMEMRKNSLEGRNLRKGTSKRDPLSSDGWVLYRTCRWKKKADQRRIYNHLPLKGKQGD